jgi:N,N'-diacetyllegionaminate synthase
VKFDGFVLQEFISWFFITGSCFSPHVDITNTVVRKAIVVIHIALVSSATAIGNNCIMNFKILVEYDGDVEEQKHIAAGATINVGSSLGESSFIEIGSKDHESINLVMLRAIVMGVTVRHDNISNYTVFRRLISMFNRTLIIAEAGVNHNGDLKLAKQLIDVAAQAGADYVKFQTFNAERIVTKTADKAEYQNQSSDSSESQFEMLKRLELSKEMHLELIEHCDLRTIKFLSTGFDIQSVDLLVGLGLNLIKIPSGEITNLPFLRYLGSLGLPVILSSGMSTMKEIDDALLIFEQTGLPRDKIIVLHCTTEYPTPMDEVNLRAMNSIRKKLGVAVGYSDHTLGIEVSVAAVALGASVIEKHFTIDRSLPGPDHKASLEPVELGAMVEAIRNVEVALGSDVKEPTNSEIKNIQVVRKSILAGRKIEIGEILSASNLVVKRPGDGISPMQWDRLVGQIACREYLPDEKIHQ